MFLLANKDKVDCGDSNPCTVDTWDTANNKCVHTLNTCGIPAEGCLKTCQPYNMAINQTGGCARAKRHVANLSLCGDNKQMTCMNGHCRPHPKARYVWVDIVGSGSLELPEVQVWTPSGQLVSLKRPTVQGSTLVGGVSWRAVDGNLSTYWYQGSISHTGSYDSTNWWRVDLGKSVAIRMIKVWTRSDCCWYRQKNLDIYITNTASKANPIWRMRAATFSNGASLAWGTKPSPKTVMVAQ